jgi:hypothetical protein
MRAFESHGQNTYSSLALAGEKSKNTRSPSARVFDFHGQYNARESPL